MPLGPAIAFTMARPSLVTTGTTLTFTFRLNQPGLVAYSLARAGPVQVAWGVYPVYDASLTYSITISRMCSPAGNLVPGAAYALFYNATDNYNASWAHGLQEIVL